MPNKIIHLVSFENPYPPNSGGSIDVFYKIKALKKQGCQIILHCFTKGNFEAHDELLRLVSNIYFYKNSSPYFTLLSVVPYSVLKRSNKELLQNLKAVEAPIFFESLKTTYFVANNNLNNKRLYLRLHNNEQLYYKNLSKNSSNIFRKIVFYFEGIKYKKFDKFYKKYLHVYTKSDFETKYISEFTNKVTLLPVFNGKNIVKPLSNTGKYCFYFADFSISHNLKVVNLLVHVFKDLANISLVIADYKSHKKIQNLIEGQHNISFVKLENNSDLETLLSESHINIDWAFQPSSTNTKILNYLYDSRFCIINNNFVSDNIIIDCCEIVESENDLKKKIINLMQCEYTLEIYNERKENLLAIIDDEINAKKIINEIFPN